MAKKEQPRIETEIFHDTEKESSVIKERIKHSLENEQTQLKVISDFKHTFEQIGLTPAKAQNLCNTIITLLKSNESLSEIENQVYKKFEACEVENSGANLIEVLSEKLKDRADRIVKQISPYLENTGGKVIDYGAGDGQVAQLLHDQAGLDIEGVDIRLYKNANVSIPLVEFDGNHVNIGNKNYETAILTNVLHHEENKEKILDELDRIIQHKLVIIETVPEGDTEDQMEEDKDRTFMNDYLYNRLFHNADIPVPGTYETPKKWKEIFESRGWKLVEEKDLGVDQPIIKDRHYLFVFEK